MCGIVAVAARRDVVPTLIAGLKALEYRGYDSAGIALLTDHGMQRRRAKGKVAELETLQNADPIAGHTGIAHTRWATHGVPAERNAHPMISAGADASGSIAVVHNGIVENHAELREELRALGYTFTSDTDTEVMAHLIHAEQARGKSMLQSVQAILPRLHGAYAIAVVSTQEPGVVVGARKGSPMVMGIGEGEQYLASDIHALLPVTRSCV